MHPATPPPRVAPQDLVEHDGFSASRSELRSRFPLLHRFIDATSFEDGAHVFPTQEEAGAFFLRDFGEDRAEIAEQLNREIEAFSAAYEEGSGARAAAFLALGSVIFHPDYIDLRLSPVPA